MSAVPKLVAVWCITVLFTLPITLRAVGPVPCVDISKVDFSNIAINVPDQELVRLKNGKGYTSPIIADGKDIGSEWEVTIESDVILRPESGVTMRVINLNSDHLLGSGAWGWAMIYACIDGKVRRVFESKEHLYGVTIKKINETTFTIFYGVYKKQDSLCCPSMQSTDTYVWFPKDGAFKRIKSFVEPWKDQE